MKIGDRAIYKSKKCVIKNIFKDMVWIDFFLNGKMGNGKWVNLSEIMRIQS